MKQHYILLLLSLVVVSLNCEAYNFTSITNELKNHFDLFDGRISWMVQKKDGTILIKEHLSDDEHEPYTDESSIHIASGCKWPAMTILMKLIEEGKLNLDDPISQFYTDDDEFPEEAQDITLLQLMTHTSGYGYLDDWVQALNITLQESVLGIAQGGTINGTIVSQDELTFSPGDYVMYGDVSMQIAGAIAEKVSEYLGDPLGMVNATFTAFDGEEGINVAIADGMYIKMTDYANFMLMLMNKGTFNGVQILQPESVETMLQDYTGDLEVFPNDDIDLDKLNFGIGHWIFNNGTYHSSNGIYQFYNYFDTVNEYLTIFYLKTESDPDEISEDIFNSLSEEIEKIVKST